MTSPQYYANPVLPGFFPDPSIVRVGEDYYLVNSTFQYFPGIIISHSRDLVHWRQIGHVFTSAEALNLSWYFDGCGVWAPDISYHDGEFYIYYCLVQLKMDRSVNTRGNYMVKSKSILGPWSEPVQLTAEGNDPSHFVDDDGSRYMLYAGGIPKGTATKIVRLSPDGSKVIGDARWIDYGIQVKAPEGPHLLKKDGWYYHTMAAGSGVYEGHHQLVARSRDIFGPYTPSPHNPFIAQFDAGSRFYHHGHAKLVQTQRGEWWAVYLVRRQIDGASPLGRETGLDKVDWLDDAWPVLNAGRGPTERNVCPELSVTRWPEHGPETFERPELDTTRWQYVRNPDRAMFSLTERPGSLRISTATGALDAPGPLGIVVQRETSHAFRATTSVDIAPVAGEEAGLLAYYGANCHVSLGVTGSAGARRVCLRECRAGNKSELASHPLPESGPIGLRMTVCGLRREFSFMDAAGAWQLAGVVEDASFLSDEKTPDWGFTGTMTGLYAVHGGSGKILPAYFDGFEMAALA